MSYQVTEYNQQPNKVFVYQPEEDITTYELAVILPILIEAWQTPGAVYELQNRRIPHALNPKIEGLEERFQRHFK